MAYLQDLTVNKISFVHKAANRRKFLLLKSGDDAGSTMNNNNNGDPTIMRKEVRTKLSEILKAEKSPDKIVEILKADTTLKITDDECVEVKETVEMFKAEVPPITPPAKVEPPAPVVKDKDPEKDALLKSNQDLMTRLEKMEKEQKRSGIVVWLQKECPFLPDDIEKTADTIMELAASSESAANKYKEALQKASAAVQASKLFVEVGKSTDALLKSESDGFDLIKKFTSAIDTIKKSDKPLSVDNLATVVRGFGADEYTSYRKAHTLRAKLNA